MKEESVTLRPLVSADVKHLTALADNKKVWDNLRDYFPYPYTEKDAIAFIDMVSKKEPIGSFGIIYHEELCGVISLIFQDDVYTNSAEIGYWVGEPFWGKGIATKAIALITKYGFENLGLRRIFAGVFEFNVISMKVLEKNGYQKEGIFKKSVIKNDRIWDEHRYYRVHPDIA